jgi:Uma2 family endonuclease
MAGRSVARSSDPRWVDLETWAAMPEEERGEVVAGELVEEEVPDFVHELVVGWLIALFRAWVVPRGGFVGGSEAKFAVGLRTGRKPDVTVFFPGKAPPRRGLVRLAPDIAVEVVSPTPRDGRRDRVDKLREYAAFGVRSYWIVDPELRSLEVLALGRGKRYVHAVGATHGTIIDIPGCAGLVVDLDVLWSEADRLPEAGKPRKRRAGQHKPPRRR